jgi:hypothetical protein
MKKTLLIIAGIGLLCVILIVRNVYRQNNRMSQEREWFVKGLEYEFSARVDSIRMFNESTGRLWCRITSGDPKVHREDSLKKLFTQHDMLYFVFHRVADSIIFILPEAKMIEKNDSVRVSSKENSIQVFRGDEKVFSDEMTDVVTGFGRPFFIKKK